MTEKQIVELKEKQWERAMSGDVRMLIWLGKQYLGQKDSPMDMNVNELPEGFDLIEISDEEYDSHQIHLIMKTSNVDQEEAEKILEKYKQNNQIQIELDRAKEQAFKNQT